MRYITKPGWKKAETEGDLYKSIAILLSEIKLNYERIPVSHPKRELAHFIYLYVAHLGAVRDVPLHSQQKMLTDVKVAKRQIKDIIRKIE